MRYFSFNSQWGPGESMASLRNGEGSDFFFVFSPAGAVGKLYAKERALGAAARAYERSVNAAAVGNVLRRQPLTAELVASLNPDLGLDEVLSDAGEIGYPLA